MVPHDQSELFGGFCWFFFLVENLWCLPVKKNHALKIGLQTYQPTKKEGFMKENDQETQAKSLAPTSYPAHISTFP